MQTKCFETTAEAEGEILALQTRLSPSLTPKLSITDRSKAVLLLLFLTVKCYYVPV